MKTLRTIRHLVAIAACLILTSTAAHTLPGQKLAEFMLSEESAGKVLHGVGQSFSNWDDHFIPYTKIVAFPPAVFSSYLNFNRSYYFDQIANVRQIADGYPDVNGEQTHFLIPLMGVNNQFTDEEVVTITDLIDAGLIDTSTWETAVRDLHTHGVTFKDEQLAAGEYDEEIVALAHAVAITPGPVLIRLMHEFGAGIHSRHVASAESMKEAWIHFVDLMDASGATNAEFVYHANLTDPALLEAYWPGDEYVDWVAATLFDIEKIDKPANNCAFAEAHGKPCLIAESAPSRGAFAESGTADLDVWKGWFDLYFDFIREHPNLKLFVYINNDWIGGPFDDWPDTRIQVQESVQISFIAELRNSILMHGDELWESYGLPPARFRNPKPFDTDGSPESTESQRTPRDGRGEPTGRASESPTRSTPHTGILREAPPTATATDAAPTAESPPAPGSATSAPATPPRLLASPFAARDAGPSAGNARRR